MTLQELAKRIYALDQMASQCDDLHENYRKLELINELEKIPGKHAIRLLLKVLEARTLVSLSDPHNPFNDLAEFNYIDEQVNQNSTDDL